MSYREHDFEDPFDPIDFVENLMQNLISKQKRQEVLDEAKTQGKGGTPSKGKELHSGDGFDAQAILSVFDETLYELGGLSERVERRVEKLMKVIQKEEKETKAGVATVEKAFEAACGQFQELDDRINNVAKKVVHLGDQLEGVNTTRSRAADAHQLMGYFAQLHSSDELTDDVFSEPSKIHEAASIMHKLHLIAAELPDARFHGVRQRIAEKYVGIQRALIKQFTEAHRNGNVEELKHCAHTLLPFTKGYEDCITCFIELSQQGQFNNKDIFQDIESVSSQVYILIGKVFENSEVVMAKFVSNVFTKRLQKYVYEQLKKVRETDTELYLKTLDELITKTTKTATKLSTYKMGSDSNFLPRLTKLIFKEHLDSYMQVELENLDERYGSVLQEHKELIAQKKAASSGLMKRRTVESACEDLTSHEIAATILHEHQAAMIRCCNLSVPSELPQNATSLFQALLESLVGQHLIPAVDVALSVLPPAEPKHAPDVSFLRLVDSTSSVVQLLEKHFRDLVVPAVGSSTFHADCLHSKKDYIHSLQTKLDQGVERIVSSQIGHVRYILNSEQKKNDFRPEDSGNMAMFTSACSHAASYLQLQQQHIRASVDGKNLQACLLELGTRFHRLLLDHLQQYSYTYMGGMVAICDVNEYRKAVKEFKVPLLDVLMETLHSLCNLLIVAPENLRQIVAEQANLANIDRSVVVGFIQLRSDHKSGKFAKIFNL